LVKKLSARRRHPLAAFVVLLFALAATGGLYAAFAPAKTAQAEDAPSSLSAVEEGKKLFLSGCSSCHGLNGQGTSDGPSLAGVGPAAVDFQVMTGRMPMAMSGPQALQREPQFSQEDTDAMAAYIASLAPGPDVPSEELLDVSVVDAEGIAAGGELFRINCAMCHNVAGAGGALTEGKFAPPLKGVAANHIYEAMLTGPQNMPVFNDSNISPEEKREIIAYLNYLDENPSVGGFDLGSLGPVSEGLFIWIFGLGGIVAITVWLTSRPN
jgi:ubiquinol-cytochrome c reductase cytochrome c subunit